MSSPLRRLAGTIPGPIGRHRLLVFLPTPAPNPGGPMPLNPIQFGKDVIDQYGRYLRTTFRLADPGLAAQLREGLEHGPGGEDRLAKGPFVFLNRPFAPGPSIEDLVREEGLGLHPALPGLFGRVRTLHRHQELALRESKAGRHVLLATGTGSGKTEGFLLPILDHCLRLRDSRRRPGVAAVLVYPMNALVNDQLERLRRSWPGTQITFGRYTGETPDTPREPPAARHSAEPTPRRSSPGAEKARGASAPVGGVRVARARSGSGGRASC